jgi:head-tail adaptor
MPGGGDLYAKVSFEKLTTGSDGAGGTTTGWGEQFIVRAGYFNAGGSEAVMAARLEGRALMRVRVRASAQTRQITTDWRMRDERSDDVWNIREVDPVSEGRGWIVLRCEKGVAT